jgi:hypothetical protein
LIFDLTVSKLVEFAGFPGRSLNPAGARSADSVVHLKYVLGATFKHTRVPQKARE